MDRNTINNIINRLQRYEVGVCRTDGENFKTEYFYRVGSVLKVLETFIDEKEQCMHMYPLCNFAQCKGKGWYYVYNMTRDGSPVKYKCLKCQGAGTVEYQVNEIKNKISSLEQKIIELQKQRDILLGE